MKKPLRQTLLLATTLISNHFFALPTHAIDKTKPVYEAVEKGPHNGKMLRNHQFAIELAIFEDGVAPEFRVWATFNQQPIPPSDLKLAIQLKRLGDVTDQIGFYPQKDFLRGDLSIYEPHSFAVVVNAQYKGQTYQWSYDNFEGRVVIQDDIAQLNGLETEIAGPNTIDQTVTTYGKLIAPIEQTRAISARFDGVIRQVHVKLGQQVNRGDSLVTIESNQGLNAYTIQSPIDGLVSARYANPGEQSAGNTLLRLLDQRQLVAELAVFPRDKNKLKLGNRVQLNIDGSDRDKSTIFGNIDYIGSEVGADGSIPVHVTVDNQPGLWSAGTFVRADITISSHSAPLTVKRDAIQAFRDFQVVYAKVGDTYEVRMLELGVQAGDWAEVTGGLPAGTEYVTSNSYVIKADIDKSGASHDH